MPPLDEILAPVHMRLYRADHHLRDLQLAAVRFDRECNGKVRVKHDHKTRERVHYLPVELRTPDAIHFALSDFIGNCRSALDRLAYAACVDGGKPMSDGQRESIAFPTPNDAAKYLHSVASQIGPFPKPAVIEVFKSLEPYPGGKDEAIFRLNRLWNTDKHRLPISVVQGATLRYHPNAAKDLRDRYPGFKRLFDIISDDELPNVAFGTAGEPAKVLHANSELVRGPFDSNIDDGVKFSFEITLDETGVDPHSPVGALMLELLIRTNDIVDRVRAAMQ